MIKYSCECNIDENDDIESAIRIKKACNQYILGDAIKDLKKKLKILEGLMKKT